MENINLNRRALLTSIAAGAFLTMPPTSILLAQEATPEGDHDHGPEPLVPARPAGEVQWTISDEGFSVSPEIQAGLNHVTVTNSGSLPTHIATFSVPEGVSDDEVMRFGAEDDDDPAPDWFASQHFPGSPNNVQPGEELHGYVTYHAGRYFAIDLYSGQHVFFVATGDSWGVPEPQADYEVGMVEMEFVGPSEVAAGSHLWRVVNNGATWHEIAVMRTPGFGTPEEALEMIMTVESPDAYPEGVVTVGGVGIVSPGVSVLLEIALEPGQHTAFCFAPDGFVGPPHAVLGMVSSFEVV